MQHYRSDSEYTSLKHERDDRVDPGIPTDEPTARGRWNLSLFFLLFHGLVSLIWGIALLVFSVGIVQVSWVISEYLKYHDALTHVLITLIATISTTQLRYTMQTITQQYSGCLMADGFTLSQLTWMQGIMQWSFLTNFRSRRKRLLWIIMYGGMGLHSASVVAILQPNMLFKHIWSNIPVPCGVDPSSLTLDVAHQLSVDNRTAIDQQSFGIGLQLGNYFEQVGGNTTTSVGGRVYVKDNLAYGAIGDYATFGNGLQDIPGVSFNAQCSDDPNLQSQNFSDIWSSVLPGLAQPGLLVGSNGLERFADQDIPDQMKSVYSDLSFNLTGSQSAMYALVYPSGNGGLLTVDATRTFQACVWKANPQLVYVQIVTDDASFMTARTLGSKDSDTAPQLIGRAVLLAVQGMAQAVHFGANVFSGNALMEPPPYPLPQTSTVLEILLADAGKAALTSFNGYFLSAGIANVTSCSSNSRSTLTHWKFGNANNLGWVAIIWTIFVGVLAIYSVGRIKQRQRMEKINPFKVAQAFALGWTADSSVVVLSQPLVIRGRRLVAKR